MKIQLLFCLLFVSVHVCAQKTGFTHFTAQSDIHHDSLGNTFIYSIGEPINSYQTDGDGAMMQGLFSSALDAVISDKAIIQVRVFIDTNRDGIKDIDEEYISQGKIQVVGGLIHPFTDKGGLNYYAEAGSYEFEYINENEFLGYTTGETRQVEVIEGDTYKKVDFGIAPDEVIEQAKIYFALDAFRCWRPIHNKLIIKNTGGAKLQKTIYLEIDERINDIHFDVEPDVIVNDHLVGWNFCLEPGQKESWTFVVTAPGVTSPNDIGQEYKLNAWVDLQNNFREERTLRRSSWILRCAYDPNDKLVVPDRADSLALLDDELVYTVRFQNTGNDVADDVVVVDTLDSNLDMSTFNIIDSSHPSHLDVIIDPEEEHIVNFQFTNIFLPDSTTNEPASNGNVTYSIKPKVGTLLNTEINNTAHIYFDFNPAIVTNTTSSTLVDTFPIPQEDIETAYTKVICEGESYEGYTEEGIYEDVFSIASGYDSIRTLSLYTLSADFQSIDKEICEGETFLGYKETGTYRDTISNGVCESIREVNLKVNAIQSSFEQIEICEGESYLGYIDSGLIVSSFKTSSSCDSTHTIELIIQKEITTTIDQEICEGETYEGYQDSGNYEDSFTSLHGCDSIRTLNLIVVEEKIESLEIEICEGETYEGYDETGDYQDELTAVNGCDSTRMLSLTVLEQKYNDLEIEICEGESFEGYDESGSYQDLFSAANGCDSTRTLSLAVLKPQSISMEIEICNGESYEGYDESGSYEDIFTSVNGCDSIRSLDLTVLKEKANIVEATVCEGETYEGYDETGDYLDIFTANNGCDSSRTLELTVLSQFITTIETEICEGESYEGYTATGTYEDALIGSDGCDSIRTLLLEVLAHSETYETIPLCIGEEYENYEDAGVYTETYTNSHGCDSIRYVEIIKLDRDDPICAYQYDSDPKKFDDTAFLDIYPNPASDVVSLIVDKPERLPAQLEVRGINKELVFRQEITAAETEIDITSYAKGVYLFVLKNENNTYIKRILKL